MLVSIDTTLPEALSDVRQEIRRGAADHKHPFRFVVLSTVGQGPSSRYVVLRQVTDDFRLLIYTDFRSEKIEQLQQNNTLQLLFYHPQKRAQVVLSGQCIIHHQNELTQSYWPRIQGSAIHSYTTQEAPGTVIEHPEEGFDWETPPSDRHFAVIEIDPLEIHLLQLNGVNHLRARFEKQDDWKGTWLVP